MSYQLSSILNRGAKMVHNLPSSCPLLQVSCSLDRYSSCQVQQVRFRGPKVRIRKPTQPTFDKKLMMAVSEPFERTDRREPWEKCKLPEYVAEGKRLKEDIHPWAILKAKKFKERLLESNIVLVLQENSVDYEPGRIERNTITKAGFCVERHSRVIQRLTFQDTNYSFLLGSPLEGVVGHGTIDHTAYILGDDLSKLKLLLDTLKKIPTYLLLFGILHGSHVLRRDQLMEVSMMPLNNINMVRGQLILTLNQFMASSLTSNVQAHMYNLTHNLDSYVNGMKKGQNIDGDKCEDAKE